MAAGRELEDVACAGAKVRGARWELGAPVERWGLSPLGRLPSWTHTAFITLYYTTLHYTELHHTTLHYSTLHYYILLHSQYITVESHCLRFLLIILGRNGSGNHFFGPKNAEKRID